MANFLIIIIIAVLGVYAVYLAMALFTKHGRSTQVPGVEKMTYSQAVQLLHDHGFRVDIRDSLYRDDIKPGHVIEQFPKAKSIVKPGRKIFLYINAVHPKEVILDDDNHPNEYALRGESHRSALARLEELGFSNIRVVKVLGTTDRVVKVMANGKAVRKMQKVPVTASMVLEVSDGRLNDLQDSLQNLEYLDNYRNNPEVYSEPEVTQSSESGEYTAPEQEAPASSEEESGESQYF